VRTGFFRGIERELTAVLALLGAVVERLELDVIVTRIEIALVEVITVNFFWDTTWKSGTSSSRL
jgi:hypothetical protein